MKKSFIRLILFILTSSLFAQVPLKSSEEEYYDFMSLKGSVQSPSLTYRTLSDSTWLPIEKGLWENNKLNNPYVLFTPSNTPDNFFTKGINQNITLKIYGPKLFNSFNTTNPYGQNDGALWQGKGYNGSFTAGVRLEGYGFELTLKPNINFSQNMAFEIMPSPKGNGYGYFHYKKVVEPGIDLVQRYGDKPFWTYDWGDTEIRYTWHNLTLGFGTQSYWLGPATINPMLGSNNAPSFPKIDIGLRKTDIVFPNKGWNWGSIEARLFVGQLKESDYFDNNQDNNNTLLTGLSFAYSPSFINGLTIGANRIFLDQWKTKNLQNILYLFALSGRNGTEDQKASFFIDWLFPKVGFEFYGEFGIDDFTSDELSNPFHTAVYTIGFKKTIPLPNEKLDSELLFEWNNFEMSQDFQMQWAYGGFYTHSSTIHGYTNRGQIIGAGSGSMGNSQYLAYKLYYPKGTSQFFIHRYCPNNNYIYNQSVNTGVNKEDNEKYYAAFDTHLVFGLTTDFFATPWLLLNGAVALDWHHNVNYVQKTNEFNVNIQLGGEWKL